MRRRDFVTLVAGATAFRPLTGAAQQKAMPVVGFLSSRSPGESAALVIAFQKGLSETAGYAEGQNLAIEYRWAEGHYDRLPALAADLVDRHVDAIAALGGITSALVAKNATATIPIVFSMGDDPVGAGVVVSLAKPGGNLTGVSFLVVALTPKRLELLSELVPQAKVIALLVNPNNPQAAREIREVQEAARTRGVKLPVLNAATETDLDAAFTTVVQLRAGALIVQADPFIDTRREQVVALAIRHAVPAIYPTREAAIAGGLISYGPSLASAFYQLGGYAGRILKGEKPADLPVEQPAKFDLIINLKTAKALGLTVPPSLLARADEVIE